MRALVLYLLLFITVNCVNGERSFRLGRRKNGNLGAPGDYKGEEVPAPQWFAQKLDHSNPSDLRTWNQVRITFTEIYKFFSFLYFLCSIHIGILTLCNA